VEKRGSQDAGDANMENNLFATADNIGKVASLFSQQLNTSKDSVNSAAEREAHLRNELSSFVSLDSVPVACVEVSLKFFTYSPKRDTNLEVFFYYFNGCAVFSGDDDRAAEWFDSNSLQFNRKVKRHLCPC